HDDRNTSALDRDRRVLTRRTTAEVLAGHDDVALLHLLRELGIDVLHHVLGELLGIGRQEIARRDDDVRINVIAEFPDLAPELHTACPSPLIQLARRRYLAGDGTRGRHLGAAENDL